MVHGKLACACAWHGGLVAAIQLVAGVAAGAQITAQQPVMPPAGLCRATRLAEHAFTRAATPCAGPTLLAVSPVTAQEAASQQREPRPVKCNMAGGVEDAAAAATAWTNGRLRSRHCSTAIIGTVVWRQGDM